MGTDLVNCNKRSLHPLGVSTYTIKYIRLGHGAVSGKGIVFGGFKASSRVKELYHHIKATALDFYGLELGGEGHKGIVPAKDPFIGGLFVLPSVGVFLHKHGTALPH